MMPQLENLDVVLNYMGRLRCDPGWRLDPQWAPGLHDYDLWYVWAGRGRMVTSHGPVELYPGRGLWMRPGRRYEAEQDAQERLGVSFVHFRLRTKRRLLALSEFVPPIEVFEARHPDYFNAALAHVTRLASRREFPPETALLLKSLLLEAAGESNADAQAPGIDQHYREAIAPTLNYLQDHPNATISDLARKSGYSLDHFSRVFHQVTGEAPKDYKVRLRLERAVTLLRESSQTISQISDALGYQDAGFFSRQFKQKMGFSPAKFRKRDEGPAD
jgi:AraC-like DNA-binding protein